MDTDRSRKSRIRDNLPGDMKAFFKTTLKSSIASISGMQKGLTGEKTLISFIFHNMFTQKSEIALNETHPIQWHTVDQFKLFIEHFLERGYGFVSPRDIIDNTIIKQKNILITFDDGYFSSLHALSVLEKYKVPAVYFITTNNIIENRLFWWDVLYRNRRRNGASDHEIFNEERQLHKMRHEDIMNRLRGEFGEAAFHETNDLNRPMSPQELETLSQHDLVTLGNHAADHKHFYWCTDDEIKYQIETAQKAIWEITGKTPDIISYPHGDYDKRISDISRKCGLSLGITTEKGIHNLPIAIDSKDSMGIGRFCFFGDSRYPSDFDVYCPELSPYFKLRDLVGRSARRLRISSS